MTLGDILCALYLPEFLNLKLSLTSYKKEAEKIEWLLSPFISFCWLPTSRNPLNGLVRKAIPLFDKIISKLDKTIKFIARKQ